MGRKAICEVKKEELAEVVAKLENSNPVIEQGKKTGKKKKGEAEVAPVAAVSPFPNRSALFRAVSESDWAKSKGVLIQPATVANWIKKFDIPLLTPVGKKGRQKGVKIEGAGRKRRGRNEENYNAMIKSLNMQSERGIAPSMVKAADRAASGSMKAAIKLKCMDCCGHDKKYVRECTSYDCALWTYRPYQVAPNGQATEESTEQTEPEVVQIALPAPVTAVA